MNTTTKILLTTSFFFTTYISAVKTVTLAFYHHNNKPTPQARFFFADQPELTFLFLKMHRTPEYQALQLAHKVARKKCHAQLKAQAQASGDNSFKVANYRQAYNQLSYQACKAETLAYHKTPEYRQYHNALKP